MALTAQQIAIVKATVPVVKQHGTTITTVFYKRLLAAHPELKSIFSLRHQQQGAQQQALAQAVFAYANYIDDLPKLSAAVERIAHKHASLFVRAEQYPIVGQFLVAAFAEVLGDALTPDVKDAWVAAYGRLADIFIARERQLMETETAEWRDWRRFVVARREPEADDVDSFYLRPVDGRPLRRYLPGQYVSVRVPVPQLDGLLQCRQFSLSTAPADGMTEYRVSVKREPLSDGVDGDDGANGADGASGASGASGADGADALANGNVMGLISNLLHDSYDVGDEVDVSPPRGEFFFDTAASPPGTPVVLLGIGVGVTPLLSILDAILASPDAAARPVSWIQAARRPSGLCFRNHVRKAAAAHANVKPLLLAKHAGPGDRQGVDYDAEGRMNLDALAADGALHLDKPDAGYYLCGPEAWMVRSRRWLLDQGVARERIQLELFGTGELEQ